MPDPDDRKPLSERYSPPRLWLKRVKPYFEDGRHHNAPYIWAGWWLITWESDRWWDVDISFMPD